MDKNMIEKMSEPVFYVSNVPAEEDLRGREIKVSVVDTGLPDHNDINNIYNHTDFSEDGKGSKDTHGHATMVSGIIGANNPEAIIGYAPDSELYFAKIANKEEKCRHNSLISGILWSVVQGTHIILISLETDDDLPVIYDACKKAVKEGTFVIAAADESPNIGYPAYYDNVISVGVEGKNKETDVDVLLPDEENYTTYLHSTYTKTQGSSIASAKVAGIASLALERINNNNKRLTRKSLQKEIISLKK